MIQSNKSKIRGCMHEMPGAPFLDRENLSRHDDSFKVMTTNISPDDSMHQQQDRSYINE